MIERCERATLVFDQSAIERTMRAIAAAARSAGISPLFAMKSFPRDEVRALAAELLDGFDVASPGELAAVPPRGLISIVDPSGLAIADAPRGRRVLVGCETVEQVRAVPDHAELAIRISASITGRDPAIGAVLEGSGRRTSRFGVDTRETLDALLGAIGARDATDDRLHAGGTPGATDDELGAAGARAPTDDRLRAGGARDAIASALHAAGTRPVGIHLHHGPVTATSAERFIATARAAIAMFADAGREPAFMNLGGAWHGIDDFRTAFAQVRAAFPGLELFVEPGRAYAADAGFATGRVLASRELEDRVLSTVELSRACHVRWSQPELVAPPPRADARRKVMFVGPTCYEEDVIGEWIVDPTHVATRIVLRNITGYAVAWNTGFGGVPPADVVLVER